MKTARNSFFWPKILKLLTNSIEKGLLTSYTKYPVLSDYINVGMTKLLYPGAPERNCYYGVERS